MWKPEAMRLAASTYECSEIGGYQGRGEGRMDTDGFMGLWFSFRMFWIWIEAVFL